MQPHQRLLLLPVVAHGLLPAQRAIRHGLAELGQWIIGLRPLGQAATAVDEVAEHDQVESDGGARRLHQTCRVVVCLPSVPAGTSTSTLTLA
jgi:thiamine monophosphate kinase